MRRRLRVLIRQLRRERDGPALLAACLSMHVIRHIEEGRGPCLWCGMWFDKEWRWIARQKPSKAIMVGKSKGVAPC
jgi:hypothetical protein